MYDLTNFTLKDMTNCGTVLRKLGADATSMEDVANRTVRYLYDHLVDQQSGARSCVLVRFFKTHPYNELDLDLRTSVQGMLGQVPEDPAMKCLTLLATAGVKPAWNDRRMSVAHKASALSGLDINVQYPMFAQLIKQFGLELDTVVQPDPAFLVDLAQKTFNVFHVPEAVGSPYIPDQTSFVVPLGIQSVLGFGGMLPTGNLFTVILFSKVPIPRETAEYFKTLALNVKMAVLPFEEVAVFSRPPELDLMPKDVLMQDEGIDREVVHLRSQVAGLDHLLAVHERVMLEQSARLEQTAERLHREATRADALARVAARLNANLELAAVLHAVCEETILALNAPAAIVLMYDEARSELLSAACQGLPQEFCAQYKPVARETYDNSFQRDGPIIIVPDIQTRLHLRNVDLFVRHNIRTQVVTSLIRENQLIGTLNIYSLDTPRSFTPDELSLLQGVADQAAVAIENARLHEQAEESAVLAERHRLARELHDSVTQSIYSVILFADASRLALEAEKTAVAADNLRAARQMAGTAIADMRLLLYELHPPELAEEGLASALHTRLDAVESRAGLQVDLNVSGEAELPLAVESELYKIAQEALNNVVKHANANAVTIQIDSRTEQFCMTIQDDGQGFALDQHETSPGMGLRSIAERVQQIKGQLSIQSAPGEGTMLQVRCGWSSMPEPNLAVDRQ